MHGWAVRGKPLCIAALQGLLDCWCFTPRAKPCPVTGERPLSPKWLRLQVSNVPLCLANGSFSLLGFILGLIPGEAEPLLMFLAWCDAGWSQVS